MFNKGGEPAYPPSAYQPVSSGTKDYVEIKWNNIRGLEVLDPDSGAKVFAHAGDSLIIAVKNWQNDTWANFMTIVLQDNNQTIQAPI